MDFFEAASARSAPIATASASAAIQPARWLPKHLSRFSRTAPPPFSCVGWQSAGAPTVPNIGAWFYCENPDRGVHRADATSRSMRVLDADEQDQPRSGTQSRGRGKLGRGRAMGSDSLESALNILSRVLGSSHSQVDR